MRHLSLALFLATMLCGCGSNAPPKHSPKVLPVTLTAANFQALVLKSKQPVLVDFWAEWCPPCRAMGPTIDELATEFQGSAVVGKVEVDDNVNQNSTLAERYAIGGIPCFLLFADGKQVARFEGFQSKSTLADSLRKLGARPAANP